MINWIKKFFVIEGKSNKRPKCSSCGLGATKYMFIEFQTLELIEIEEKIMIKICDGCYEEIYERYIPNCLAITFIGMHIYQPISRLWPL